ncbi:MAG: hypothetical protein ACFFCS_14035 [Candidatus Hodarchaeota archaeon]
MAAISQNFNQDVFSVPSPECPHCHNQSLDFVVYFDYQGSGKDWCIWYCSSDCGYNKSVMME